jgi:hypothetical protein
MGQWVPPFYGKSKFYAKKKERASKKIAKLNTVIAECDRAIVEAAKNEKLAKN